MSLSRVEDNKYVPIYNPANNKNKEQIYYFLIFLE